MVTAHGNNKLAVTVIRLNHIILPSPVALCRWILNGGICAPWGDGEVKMGSGEGMSSCQGAEAMQLPWDSA